MQLPRALPHHQRTMLLFYQLNVLQVAPYPLPTSSHPLSTPERPLRFTPVTTAPLIADFGHNPVQV
jgi:hypothetical protein